MKIKYYTLLVLLPCCIFIMPSQAQEIFTTKIVSHQSKMGISAVFEIKALNIRQSSADDGRIAIKVPNGKHMVSIRSIGYQSLDTSIVFPTNMPIIALRPIITSLDEVQIVSTGYQNLPKERATGSFVTVSNSLFNEQVGTDVLNRLEGIASSLSVDRVTNNSRASTNGGIMIRGLSTIGGPREPLVILDNFPYEGAIENINPNDIENITILKDAAAASIWGARAGNGVIVISTKRAKLGQGLKISGGANFRIAAEPDLFNKPQLSPSEFIDLEQFLFSKGAYTSSETAAAKPALSPVVELMIAARDGKISAQQLNQELNKLRNQDLRQQMAQYVYQPAVFQQYHLDLKGSSAASAWNIGLGLDRNENELASQFSRINLKADHFLQLNSRLQLNTRINYTQNKTNSGKAAIEDVTVAGGELPLYTQIADENGNALPVMRSFRQSYLANLPAGLLNWDYYPLTDYQFDQRTIRSNEVLVNAALTYKILKGLQAEFRYQYQRQQINNDLLNGIGGYFARNVINGYTQIDAAGVLKRIVPAGAIRNSTSDIMNTNNLRGQLNYNLTQKKHQLAVLLASEFRKNDQFNTAYTTYGYNDDILTFANVDFSVSYPNYVTGSRSFIPNNMAFNGLINKNISLLGNAAYTYKNRYTASFSARKDASNLFGVNANDRWNPFWSAGLSWLLSEERFLKIDLINSLKLRATYGTSGNTNSKMAAVTTLTYGANSAFTQSPTAGFSNYANPELRWEKVSTLNLGLDFQTKLSGLSGSIEFYQKNGTDLFGSERMDYTTGVGAQITKNTANMKAYGLDIELSANANLGALKWSPSLFLNFYRDRVVNYLKTSLQGSDYVNGNLVISAETGRPVHALYSYPWAGLDPTTGDPQGYYKDEISKVYTNFTGPTTTVSDLVYHGPIYAPFSGAVGNNFQYKNFSLAFRVNYKFGNYLRRSTINYAGIATGRRAHSDYSLRWQQPGDEAKTSVPSFVYPVPGNRDAFYEKSEVTAIRGDVVRLQYVNISYLLAKKQFKWLPVQQLQCFAVANNLGTLYRGNNLGIDPEYQLLPPAKTIAFGIRTEF